MLRLALTSALLVFATTAPCQAGATTPTLALSAGNAVTATNGLRLATFSASYDYSNAVQADYDLELIVFQGTTFARYPVSGPVRIGTSATLTDGLAVGDLAALDAAGAPAPVNVRVVAVAPTEMSVVLPANFSTSNATAVLVATVDEGPVLSNPLVFALP